MEKKLLIARWLDSHKESIPIYDEASVSTARQRVREAGRQNGLKLDVVETAALIASELTNNQLAHARHGYFGVRGIERAGVRGLELIAADIGPGLPAPTVSMQDSNSTRGSLGAGLGVVLRNADDVEIDNRISEGLCIVARKFESTPVPLCCEAAIMGRPYPGETISGDDAAFFQTETGFAAAVCDGLGHGPEAREASNRAIDVVNRNREMPLPELVALLNDELSSTRGCAVSLVRFDRSSRVLECASVGDVHSHLYDLRAARFFTATPLILGSARLPVRKIRVESEIAAPGSVLVMFTDGLKSRTSLKGQLDVLRQPMIGVAEHLLANDSRPDDDALVLAARFRS